MGSDFGAFPLSLWPYIWSCLHNRTNRFTVGGVDVVNQVLGIISDTVQDIAVSLRGNVQRKLLF